MGLVLRLSIRQGLRFTYCIESELNFSPDLKCQSSFKQVRLEIKIKEIPFCKVEAPDAILNFGFTILRI